MDLFNNLEPKFKKINHKVLPGETFDNILTNYSVKKTEISEIKKNISKKTNLNKLISGQKIQFTIDQKNNIVKEFNFQIHSIIGNKINVSSNIISNNKIKFSVKEISNGYYFVIVANDKSKYKKALKFLKK